MERVRVGITSFAMLLVAWTASAQTSVNGRVTNAQGGVVANAEVTLDVLMPSMPGMPVMRNANAPPPQTARSGGDGGFAFPQVAPGRYILIVDAPGFGRSSQEIMVPSPQPFAIALEVLEVPGGEAATATPAGGTVVDTQALLDRIKVLEQRLSDLESGTVLSEPETRVKRIEV